MIIFQRVRYKNILSTGDQWTTVELEKNPETLIVGTNGAGKSTILDALTFALFDKPFRKINKARLVNSVNGKGLLVELNFRVGDTEYMIRRGIKPNKFEVYRDKELIDQDGANKDYQAYLEKNILKMNFKSFTQVVILGSSTFVPFMELPAADRRAIVEDLLDIEVFSRMNILAKGKLSSIKNDVLELQSNVRLTAEKLSVHTGHLTTLEAEQKSRVADAAERIERATVENDARIAALIAENKARLESMSKDNESLAANIADLTEKAESIRAKLSKAEEIRGMRDTLNGSIREAKTLMGTHQRTVDFFTGNDTCPTCTQAIEAGFKKNITDTNAAEIKKYKAAVTGHEENLAKVLEKIVLIEKALVAIKTFDDQIAVANNKISSNTYNTQTIQREESRAIETIKQGTKATIDALKRDAEGVDAGKIEETRKKINELSAEARVNQTNLGKKEQDAEEYGIIVELLKDSGIKTQIVKQYLPIMNKYINDYMEKMNFPAAFELDDEFNETIKSRHRNEFQYANFSEGEKQRINLSLLLTWRKISQMRNSASTNLLVLDEVFDSSLDDDGTEGFMTILKGLGQETNIFVISHKGDILFERFNNVLEFYKDGNFSQLKEKMD